VGVRAGRRSFAVDNPQAAHSHCIVARLCCRMSSDPLPLPEIWSDLPKGDTYESARTEFVANGRSGLVLIEYASSFVQSDPQPVVRPIERAEQLAASERVPTLAPAALAKGLADLTAIVTQAEALLRAQGTLKGDVHFAVERIHDVAMALRMRDVDTALCDTLEASVREVGDAVVRHEAAATGALSAAALLRDVMHRIEDLAVVASRMNAPDADPLVRPSARESEATIEVMAVVTKTEAIIEEPAPVASEAEATIDTSAPVVTEAEAAIDTLAPVAIEAEATIQMLAPVATEAEGTNQTLAAVASEAEAAIGALGLVATEAEAAIETLAPVASEAEAAIEFPTPSVTEAEAVIETLAPIVSEADATIESRVDEFLTRPEAEAVHKSEAEVADTPLTPVDILISDENHARALLDAASDNAAVDDDAVYEAPAIGESVDDAAVPAESPAAAPHPQDDINVVAEIPEHKDEAARAVAVESVSAAPVIETASAALAIEAGTSAAAATRGGQEPPQVASSPSSGESLTAAAAKPRRPANDPLAALYGLSEEELIALFS
jgi:uncharacterized protein YoxC